MQIWVDENIPLGDVAFAPYGQVYRFHGRKLCNQDLKTCDALIVRSITQVNATLLDQTPVRFVGTATIGVDHIDQAYLTRQEIGFSAAPGCNARSVGEYVVAALLHLHIRRQLPLYGKTLGIVGYGHVGKSVAQLAPELGLKLMLCDPPLQAKGEMGPFVAYTHLLSQADIVSYHTPLTTSGPYPTASLFNSESLQNRSTPITLLNTCRGEVTAMKALLAAKQQGKISHLLLDVFSNEPRPHPDLIAAADIVSPHIAGYSLQGKLGGTQQVQAAFCRHFALPNPKPLASPAPDKPLIEITPVTSALPELALIDYCVQHAYDIMRDDAALRLALKESDPGTGFDRLRQKYPVRHEFRNFLVSGLQLPASGVRTHLRNLGFQIEDGA